MGVYDNAPARAARRMATTLAGVAALGLMAAGCGSSSDDSKGQATASPGAATTTSDGGTAGGAVVPGIRTLDELYKGTEEQPPASGPKAAPGKFVVWVSCGQITPGCSVPAEAAGEAAKAMGWKFSIVDAKLNAEGGFAKAILQAIALRPDAIMTTGFNCDVAPQALAQAKSAKIPVIGVQNSDCDEAGGHGQDLFPIEYQSNSKFLTGPQFWEEFGRLKADAIINLIKGKGKVINADFTNTLTTIISGYHSEMAKCSGCDNVDAIKLVASDQSPTGPIPGSYQTAIQRHPDAKALVVTFDTEWDIGLAPRLNAIPATKKLIVAGGEGAPAGMDLLRKSGTVPTFEIAYDARWIGWSGVDEVNRYFHKMPAVPEGVGFRMVDRQHNLNPSGGYQTSIDFEGAYTKVWQGR